MRFLMMQDSYFRAPHFNAHFPLNCLHLHRTSFVFFISNEMGKLCLFSSISMFTSECSTLRSMLFLSNYLPMKLSCVFLCFISLNLTHTHTEKKNAFISFDCNWMFYAPTRQRFGFCSHIRHYRIIYISLVLVHKVSSSSNWKRNIENHEE